MPFFKLETLAGMYGNSQPLIQPPRYPTAPLGQYQPIVKLNCASELTLAGMYGNSVVIKLIEKSGGTFFDFFESQDIG